MNLIQTINGTKENIRVIRDYLDQIENNNNEKADRLAENIFSQPINGIDEALMLLNDYNQLTTNLRKLLAEYYGEK